MKIDQIIQQALQEDMPSGDLTTDALRCETKKGQARLVAKQDLVLSGCELFEETFKAVDPRIEIQWRFKDGQNVSRNQEICRLEGSWASLLKGERTALNFLGHLSGIATLTSRFAKKAQGTKTKITDTRKTTPGLRSLEKKAVLDGGGVNHRMDLSSAVLIKENHVAAAGGISEAIMKIRERHPGFPIELEVRDITELKEGLENRIEKVLLDNMTLEEMAEAVKVVGGRCLIEASGNMNLERVDSVIPLGLDFISVGQITHSAPVADVSLLFEKGKETIL